MRDQIGPGRRLEGDTLLAGDRCDGAARQTSVGGNNSGQGRLARFGLGAAQFGMHYGKFNRDGMPSRASARAILQAAAGIGLSCIDTAHLYGESEAVLGSCVNELDAFSIITKTPIFPNGKIERQDAVKLRNAFYESLRKMRQKSIDGLLVHHAPNLLSDGGDILYEEMLGLKADGLVRRIGVSAYTGEIVEKIHQKFPLDFVQLPINILDRRLTRNGDLLRLSGFGIKIHARSAFLQGLLLATPDLLPGHFDPVKNVLKAFHARVASSGMNPAQVALHYLLRLPEIEKIVVGVESLEQLKNIFEKFPDEIEIDLDEFFTDRVEILNPALWVN